MKKKLITIVIGAMLCAGLFAGCGQSDTKQDKASLEARSLISEAQRARP